MRNKDQAAKKANNQVKLMVNELLAHKWLLVELMISSIEGQFERRYVQIATR